MLLDTLKAVRPKPTVEQHMFRPHALSVYDGKSRNPKVREGKGKHAGGVGK